MPVGRSGLLFKEKFRKSDFKFKSQATQDEVAEHRALDERTTRLAPNGKRSNLTDRQYDLVRTPSSKDWFGDWENDPANASKVVDENGEPRVVYHGSFWDPLAEKPGKGAFSVDKVGSNFENVDIDHNFFFTASKRAAEGYGDHQTAVFLNVRDPEIHSIEVFSDRGDLGGIHEELINAHDVGCKRKGA